MLLQKLIEYSKRHNFARPGYNRKPVRYRVDLNENGQLMNPQLIEWVPDGEPYGIIRAVPDNGRTGNIAPRLLADDVRYTFGISDSDQPEGANEHHLAYMRLLERCAEETNDDNVHAVVSFLHSNPLTKLTLPSELNHKGIVEFRVNNIFPTEQRVVQEFWEKEFVDLAEAMECIGCGKQQPVLRVLPDMVKGIPGGQANGAALISSNEKAFFSYGLENARIAPICLNCADSFTKAINNLLQDRRTSFVMRIKDRGSAERGVAFAFWTREDVEFDIFSFMDNPDSQQVEKLLESILTGKQQSKVDDVAFYAVTLTANSARAVVRDWIDSTIGNIKVALANWFTQQQIVDEWGQPPRALSIYSLAAATVPVRKGKAEMKELPLRTPQTLIQSALKGTPLPAALLQQVVNRCRIGDSNKNKREHVTYERAALIKLILASQSIIEENAMVQLQTERTEAAYHCGRLLAVLEQIQQAALGRNVNTTIVDRFYGTASTAPATVFGTLLGQAQPHLSKLRRSNRENVAYALQSRLEEVLLRLPNFPRTLTLQDQALFALGYYHQRAHDHAQAAANANAKKNANQNTSITN